MYILSLASLFRLRRIEPQLERPFATPVYPVFPVIALVIALVSLVAIVWFNPQISAIFLVLGVLGGVLSMRYRRGKSTGSDDPLLQTPNAPKA